MDAETCTNCEQPVAHAPVFFDGRAYCCVGCLAGGPCLCTYEEPARPSTPAPRPTSAAPQRAATNGAPAPEDPRRVVRTATDGPTSRPAPVAALVGAADQAPLPPSAIPAARPPESAPRSTPRPPVVHRPAESGATPHAHREPIPFRRPGGITVVVHVDGFAGQRELLTFADVMERSSDFSEVSLTRVAAGEAWMTVRAETPQEVAVALARLPGIPLHVRVDQNLVEGHVRGMNGSGSNELEAPAHGSPKLDGDQLLPQRPRFRAFRPQADSDVRDPIPPQSAAPTTPPPSAVPPRATVRDTEAAQTAMARPRRFTPIPPAPIRREPRAIPPAAEQAPAAPLAPLASTRPSRPTSEAEPPAAPTVAPAPAAPEAVPPPPRPAAPAASAPQSRTSPRPAAPPPAARPPATQSAPPAASPPSATQPATFEEAPADEFVEPEDRPGGAVMTVEHLTLVVYPFHSFAALNEFQAAVRGLHGVKNTRVRRFYRGTLHLAVDYEDMIPLADRMADLKDVEFEIASESRSELEIVLRDTSSLAAAGGS